MLREGVDESSKEWFQLFLYINVSVESFTDDLIKHRFFFALFVVVKQYHDRKHAFSYCATCVGIWV